jgi:hypothetical protein
MIGYSEKENEYINRIKELELKILSSDKADLIILQRTNKENELLLNNLNKSYQNLQTKYTESTQKFATLSEELITNKQNILYELEQLEKLKLRLKENLPTINQSKSESHIKYNKPITPSVKPVSSSNTNSVYNIRRSTRLDII